MAVKTLNDLEITHISIRNSVNLLIGSIPT